MKILILFTVILAFIVVLQLQKEVQRLRKHFKMKL